jgi:metal-responsive CopG/Arc/MetJ family transcriptional regulator
MESVTIKIEENLSKRMSQFMNLKGYATKTEFIREAIRDKLDQAEQKQLVKKFMKFKGKSNMKTTYEQNKKTREKVALQIAKEFGINL